LVSPTLFGFHDFRMHVVMTMTVAASLALVVVHGRVGLALRGEVRISPDAYQNPEVVGRFAVQHPGRTGDAPQAVRK
jgi:hypothetical protein